MSFCLQIEYLDKAVHKIHLLDCRLKAIATVYGYLQAAQLQHNLAGIHNIKLPAV
jgi:hypothetical protein